MVHYSAADAPLCFEQRETCLRKKSSFAIFLEHFWKSATTLCLLLDCYGDGLTVETAADWLVSRREIMFHPK